MRAIAQVLKPDGQVWPMEGPNWGPEYFLKRAIARAAKASAEAEWNRHAEYVGLSVQECKRRAMLRLEQGQYEFGHMDSEYLRGREVGALDSGHARYFTCRGCTWRGWATDSRPLTQCPACGAWADGGKKQTDFEEAAQ